MGKVQFCTFTAATGLDLHTASFALARLFDVAFGLVGDAICAAHAARPDARTVDLAVRGLRTAALYAPHQMLSLHHFKHRGVECEE